MDFKEIDAEARSGDVVLLHDRERGSFALGRWAAASGSWTCPERAKALPIEPTHWAALDADAPPAPPRRRRVWPTALAAGLAGLLAGVALIGSSGRLGLKLPFLAVSPASPASVTVALVPVGDAGSGMPAFVTASLGEILPPVQTSEPPFFPLEQRGTERERRRAEQAIREAALLRDELNIARERAVQLEARAAAAGPASGSERADDLAQELATERQLVQALTTQMAQASAAHAETVRSWLAAREAAERETQRADGLQRELAARPSVAVADTFLDAEKRRADDAVAALEAARASLRDTQERLLIAQAGAARTQASADREPAAALARSLEAERRDRAAEAAGLRQSLEDAQARLAALQGAFAERAGAAQRALADTGAATSRAAEAEQRAAEQARRLDAERAARLAAEAAAEESRRELGAAQDRAWSLQVQSDAERAARESSAQAKRAEAERMIARAQALVRARDIPAARTLLERAVEAGSAQAAFALAETYDPRALAAGVAGVAGDPARARELYAIAVAGGVAAGAERIAQLK